MLSSYLIGLTLGALASGAAAQESSAAELSASSTSEGITGRPSPTRTSSASDGPPTHTVYVGRTPHKFDPEEILADIGDIVRFIVYPGGHSVIRAEFKYPCVPYEMVNTAKTGFYSGPDISPTTIKDDVEEMPKFDLKINNSDPLFFYCGATGSCIQYQMIGVINPLEHISLNIQRAFAENTTRQLIPGDPRPSDLLDAPQPTTTGDPSQDKESSSGLSAGAIAGIAIGGFAAVVLAGALIYLCGRRGGFHKAYRKSIVPGGEAGGGPGVGAAAAVAGAGAPEKSDTPAYSVANAPKSPGQSSFSTYVNTMDHDQYRAVASASPQNHYYGQPGSPPLSPPMQQHGYSHAPGPYGGPYSPPLHGGMYPPQHHMVGELSAPSHYTPPAELPSVDAPIARSPPPQYPAQMSPHPQPGHKA